MSAPHCRALLALLPFALATLPAQDPPKPGSPESQALLDKACHKMLALGRGAFRTVEEQDSAILRQMGRGGGGGESEDGGAEGGWHAGMLWARAGADADLIVRQHGRTLVQTGKEWRIRRDKLPSGMPLPALFDPDLFFQVVRDLPAEARRVCSVEAAKIGDRDVFVLAVTLEGEAAAEFAQTGALPPVAGFGAMPSAFLRAGARTPQPQVTVDLGLFVEPQGGDVLRLRAKVYEKTAQGAGMRIAVAGGPGGAGGAGGFQVAAPAEAEKEADKEKEGAELVYKKGLPERKPGQQVSSMYLKVDFTDLGKAKPPELDDAGKRLLGR